MGTKNCFSGYKGRGREADDSTLYLVSRLRVSGAMLPHSNVPSRRAKGQLYYDCNLYLNPVLSVVVDVYFHSVVATLILHTSSNDAVESA